MRWVVWGIVAVVAGAGPYPDPARWVGQSQAAFFDDAAETARFQAALTAEEFRYLELVTERSEGFRAEGGWVVLVGCSMVACASERGGIGIEVASGTPVAVMVEPGMVHVFAPRGQVLPPSLARLAGR